MNEDTKKIEDVRKELAEGFIESLTPNEEIQAALDDVNEMKKKLEAARIAAEAEKLRLMELSLTAMKQAETRTMFHRPTSQHGDKKRGVGITRKVKEQSKKARKQSKQSRRINRGK